MIVWFNLIIRTAVYFMKACSQILERRGKEVVLLTTQGRRGSVEMHQDGVVGVFIYTSPYGT